MLRNVLSSRATGGLRRVGYWRVDAGMDSYLTPLLSDRWPRLRIDRYRDTDALTRLSVDIWVCGEEPPLLPDSPVLILGAIASQPAVDQIAAHAWRFATPITGRRFVADIQRLLAMRGDVQGNASD
jgi:hypothetical protein